MEPSCLVLSDDLLDASRIIGEARAAGWSATQCRDSTALLTAIDRKPRLVIIDLHNPGLDVAIVVEALKTTGAAIVGFGSHVDAARLKAARQAGCNEVMPRSSFFADLGSKFANWATLAETSSDP